MSDNPSWDDNIDQSLSPDESDGGQTAADEPRTTRRRKRILKNVDDGDSDSSLDSANLSPTPLHGAFGYDDAIINDIWNWIALTYDPEEFKSDEEKESAENQHPTSQYEGEDASNLDNETADKVEPHMPEVLGSTMPSRSHDFIVADGRSKYCDGYGDNDGYDDNDSYDEYEGYDDYDGYNDESRWYCHSVD